MDAYKVLGVSTTATKDQIKQAYRKLAHQHHPDKGGNAEKFKEINAAYQWLEKNHTPHQALKNPRTATEANYGFSNPEHFYSYANTDPFAAFREQMRQQQAQYAAQQQSPSLSQAEEAILDSLLKKKYGLLYKIRFNM